MRASRAALLLATVALAAVSACSSGQQAVNEARKVTICHATSSASNPYVSETVAKEASVGGHDGHANDIIPPFDYLDNSGNNQHYPGKNWNGNGQATYENGCEPPTSTTSAAKAPASEPLVTQGVADTSRPIVTAPPIVTTAAPSITTLPVTTPPPGTAGVAEAASTTTTIGPAAGAPTSANPASTSSSPSVSAGAVTTSGSNSGAATSPGAGTSTTSQAVPATGRNAGSTILVAGLFLLVGAIALLLGQRPATRR